MKKILASALSVIMLLSLSACGNEAEKTPSQSSKDSAAVQDNDPVSSPAEETEPVSQTEPAEQPLDIDFAAIMSGDGTPDIIYSELSPEQKQQLISEAEADGVEVTFNADGSTTFVDAEGEYVQSADGTWNVKTADGDVTGQIGGEWPDNEFTRLVPKPDFDLEAASEAEGTFGVSFPAEVTAEQIRGYVEKLKAAGFDINSATEDQSLAGMTIYTFYAENADGYSVSVFAMTGSAGMSISKE